jgi:hypothetical protein
VAEESRGENEVVQLVNHAANAAEQTLWSMPLVTSSAMQPMLPIFSGMPRQTIDTTQELSLLQSRPIVQKQASVTT